VPSLRFSMMVLLDVPAAVSRRRDEADMNPRG
jgi:hypothetical protein